MTTESVVSLTFPARADYLLLARLALSGVVRHLRLEEEQLADLKLAVTEACGNAVRHAYEEGDGDGPVGVAFVVSDDRLVMIVEDQGEGIDGDVASAEPAEAPLESGMGMTIIRTIVDELEVVPGADGRGTLVRMTKFLRAPS